MAEVPDTAVQLPAEPELDRSDALEVLRTGEMEVLGRMTWSSNLTLLAVLSANGVEMPVVYKPRRGERPLWDFPDGTLCQREVAAFEVADVLGWGIVPETVLRDGPYGFGMVQRFVEHDPDEHYFALMPDRADELAAFAVLDVIINNADRKGGHVMRSARTGNLHGIDHGLAFHVHPKLRTVIWDFAGDAIPPELLDQVCRVVVGFEHALGDRLGALLTVPEIEASRERAAQLVGATTFPHPDQGHHSVPWPLI